MYSVILFDYSFIVLSSFSFDFVWEVILAIEIIAGVTGIGTFINSSVSTGSVEYAYAGIFAVGLIAVSVDRFMFRTLENRIARWR